MDRPSRASSRGQALVEASLIMPVLLLVVLIGVDFGRLYAAQVTVADAARQAARYGASNPADAAATSLCAPSGWQASVAVAQQEAQGSTVSIACSGIALASGGPDAYGGQYVKADVTAPFSFVTPFLTPLFSINHVTASDTARESSGTAGLIPPTPTPTPTPVPTPTPTPTPAPSCVYSGEAWAASTSGLSAVDKKGALVAVADTKLHDSGVVPSAGGAAPNNGSLATITLQGPQPSDPHVIDGTVANQTANGATCAGSAHSSVASLTLLAGQGALGADIADFTTVVADTAQSKGAAAVQSTSVASIKINGQTIAVSATVNATITINGVCTIYINSQTPGASPPSVDSIKVVFPAGGALATQIVGTVIIGHAQQGVQ